MKKLLVLFVLLMATSAFAIPPTAYVMPFGGAANSYWVLDHVDLNANSSRATLYFLGYTDSTRQYSFPPKTYVVSGTEYATWFAPSVLSTADPYTQAWNYALQKHEFTGGGPGPNKQPLVDTGSSFFHGGATQ